MDFECKSITLQSALNKFEDLNEIEEFRLSIDEDSLDESFPEEISELFKYIPNLKKLLILYTSQKSNDLLHVNINDGISQLIESMYLEGIDLSEIDLSEFFRKHPVLTSIRLDNCNISNIEFLENMPDLVAIDLSNNPIPAKYADYILDFIQKKSIFIDIHGCTEIFEEFEKKNLKFSKFLTEKDGNLDGESFYQAYQRALFSRSITIKDMQQLEEYIDFFSETLAKESRSIYVDDMEEFDEGYIESINKFGIGENNTLHITPKQAQKLMGKVSPKVKVLLLIKDCSELSVEQLDLLSEHYNLISIKIDDPEQSLNYEQKAPYDIETYRKCRATIDDLLGGIDLSENTNDPNKDKKLFGKVIKILANHMSYDYESLRREERPSMKFFEEAIARFEEGNLDSDKYLELISSIQQEDEMNETISIVCRNMQGGLLNNTCVCAGYAEIVRNVFSCLNIPVRYIWGYNTIEPSENPHAWNQIKLDGQWYNMDLTWSRDSIVAGEKPKHLLQSDKDFNTEEHPYDAEICQCEDCNQTVSITELMKYIYGIYVREEETDFTVSESHTKKRYYLPRERRERREVHMKVADIATRKKEILRLIESDIAESDIEKSYDILIKTDDERKRKTASIEMEEH